MLASAMLMPLRVDVPAGGGGGPEMEGWCASGIGGWWWIIGGVYEN